MSRWEIAANISGTYGDGYIRARGVEYRHRPQPYYGWGVGPHGGGGYGWSRSGAGIGFNVTIGIGAFFRDLFHRGPPATPQQPVYYDPTPVADRYQRGGTLGDSAWQPYDPRTRLDAGGGTDAYIIGAHPLTPRERTNQSMFRSLAIDTTAPRDLTSLRAANDPSWGKSVYGDYMGIRGVHIGNG